MTALIISLAMLGAGPAIYARLRRKSTLLTILDLVVITSITGLIVFEIVPDSVRGVGWIVLIAVAFGALAPTALEHVLHRTELHHIENWTHRITLVVGLSGLGLHAMFDGAAIASAGHGVGDGNLLSLAIVLHRLPVGLTVWWLLRPSFGKNLAALVLTAMAGATIIGFAAGTEWERYLTGPGGSWFQAFVAGSLLHVIFFRKHLDHS